jgi:AcrR family transcriptional regulator
VTDLPDTVGGIRDRFRPQIRGEVKQVALRQLAEGGPQALSVNAIAKELGVSGPALYRYFASRDALLTELVADAYHDVAVAVADATPVRLAPPDRFRAFAAAYRQWADAEPHRYRLLFAAPIPGYDAQAEPLVAASQEVMNVLVEVLRELAPPTVRRGRTTLDRQLGEWAKQRKLSDVSPAQALHAIITWTRLHGLVSLEIEGNFASMGIDPQLLFDTEVAAILSFQADPSRRSRA